MIYAEDIARRGVLSLEVQILIEKLKKDCESNFDSYLREVWNEIKALPPPPWLAKFAEHEKLSNEVAKISVSEIEGLGSRSTAES